MTQQGTVAEERGPYTCLRACVFPQGYRLAADGTPELNANGHPITDSQLWDPRELPKDHQLYFPYPPEQVPHHFRHVNPAIEARRQAHFAQQAEAKRKRKDDKDRERLKTSESVMVADIIGKALQSSLAGKTLVDAPQPVPPAPVAPQAPAPVIAPSAPAPAEDTSAVRAKLDADLAEAMSILESIPENRKADRKRANELVAEIEQQIAALPQG